MNELWRQYLIAEKKCLKNQWKMFLDEFIHAYFQASEDDRAAWLSQNVHLIADDKVPMRHSLFEKIIFPYLFDGYQKHDLTYIKQLGRLYRHIDSLNAYRRGEIGLTLDSLLKLGLSLSPNDQELLMLAYGTIKSDLEYSVHELPSGILYGSHGADGAQCLELLEDLSDFEEVCQKLGKDETAFINMCRWHYQHYPIYRSCLQQKQFQSYLEYIQFFGGPQTP